MEDIVIKKDGVFKIDLSEVDDPVISVSKALIVAIDLVSNKPKKVTFFIQNSANVTVRIFTKNLAENIEILAELNYFSRFNIVFADFLDKDFSLKSNTILLGESSYSSVKFASLAKNKNVKKYNISFDHIGEKSESILEGYIVSEDEAFVSANGISHIEKDAIKTKASQKIKGIIFDEKAKISANPILKIDCDDIEANHACSIGNLNEDHIFYLMSRGINEEEARKLIVSGYLTPVSENFNEEDRTLITSLIEGEL